MAEEFIAAAIIAAEKSEPPRPSVETSPSAVAAIKPGTTVIASPVVTTIYTVVGTSAGCSSSATVSVSYSNAVTLAPTSNQNPGCSPLSTILHANASNPTGTAANYIFTPGLDVLNPMSGALTQIVSLTMKIWLPSLL